MVDHEHRNHAQSLNREQATPIQTQGKDCRKNLMIKL